MSEIKRTDLLEFLNEKEKEAFDSQMDPFCHWNEKQLAWCRGYRIALEEIASRFKLDLTKAG